jgi:hypothetical protein
MAALPGVAINIKSSMRATIRGKQYHSIAQERGHPARSSCGQAVRRSDGRAPGRGRKY